MNTLENLLLEQKDVKVIDANRYAALDLSAGNDALSRFDTTNSAIFEDFIEHFLTQTKAEAAFGGYKEMRSLYQRSTIFNDSQEPERNIHIGLDLWIAAGTPVLAALDGMVHSFDYNSGLGDYGPTIILKHQIDGVVFYSLYGHLSMESIEELEIDDVFKKGAQLGTLGAASVNGDYAPHLHFQIIKDIEDHFGDYPGVCTADDLDYYQQNCPDPNLLLKLKS